MTENKRYSEQNLENHLNRIYDNHECKVIFDEEIVDLLNEQDAEIKRLKCINRQLEERLDRSIALNMSKCGKYVYEIHGGSND